jgi:hypothetical protein
MNIGKHIHTHTHTYMKKSLIQLHYLIYIFNYTKYCSLKNIIYLKDSKGHLYKSNTFLGIFIEYNIILIVGTQQHIM